MNLLQEIKLDAHGASLLKDWLGQDGRPVDSQLAYDRALVCLTCPENRAHNWWDLVKDAVADIIRTQLEVKNRMDLSTPWDDDLNMCRPCGCCTRLKIHVPIEHIRNHTPSKTAAQFPPNCWILRELAE